MSAARMPHEDAPREQGGGGDDAVFPPLRGEEFGQPAGPDAVEGHDDDACAQAIARVHAFLTNQLPASQADLIRAHLDACEKCLDDFDIEATISRLLKKSCGSPGAPDSLRVRVMTLHVQGDDPAT